MSDKINNKTGQENFTNISFLTCLINICSFTVLLLTEAMNYLSYGSQIGNALGRDYVRLVYCWLRQFYLADRSS